MVARESFQQSLGRLQDQLLIMSDLCATAMSLATAALVERDAERAREVVAGDQRINELWTQLEREVVALIATQQPMAGDLREILSVAMIATDLERIGDHAKHVASDALALHDAPPLPSLPAVEALEERVESMLRDAMVAFVERDGEAARAVASQDEQVDAAYNRLHRQLIAAMIEDSSRIDLLHRLVSVSKRLERSGDHVTNICEQVVFLSQGVLVELNP